MAPPYPYPTLIYHITHIKNLASILETGGLLPLNRSPRHQSIAYEHIRERRGQTRVPLKPGGTLNDYVPFYFCPRSPMLYAVHTGSTDYWGGQTPILHLVSSVQAVHAKGLDFVFTDQHAVLLHARFFNNPQDLSKLDWGAIQASFWSQVKAQKQAEFLVYDFFPWDLVQEIGVIDDKIAQEVRQILQRFPNRRHPPVRVRRDWYY
ncbi:MULTISPECIES: type II toxin-antitoxin system toxin DNA ADP-ribosyl transferase DarT [Thermus]|uniref:DarT domain-containing protein n=1 Tax=Thermus scotoductus TaxID=37636 RepID=A0A430S067_THESC|nr:MULTISPECIES: DUF4433 domain-containing protein [Thermus]AYJ74821.1 hypothetical protein phiMa_38 [Thermus phage phiMa]RTH02404.1 hypothetical protein CSW50_07645 [Thermus scotoductus]RTH26831.1 hypothetical protein CSW38_05005 [Thermus scotoductus]BDG27182.1 hypothetical protein TthSNM66_18180 [Thermus thermophilus]